MLGRNHVLTNTASVIILGTTVETLAHQSVNKPFAFLTSPAQQVITYMTDDKLISLCHVDWIKNAPYLFNYLFLIVSFLLFILGSVLPDIDSPSSLLGRHVYVNIQHRTWTHAIWGVMVLCLIGIYFRPMMWCALGVFLHLFWDSLSFGGNCWFYPFSKYVDYTGGVHIKRYHKLKIYHVGQISEYIVVVILIILSVFTVIWGIMNHIYM